MTGPLGAPIHRFFRGAVVWRTGVFPAQHRARVRAFEELPAAAKRARSLDLLRHAVFRAYHAVPWYKARFDAAGVSPRDLRALGDLAHFPILEKRDVIEHRDELVSAGRDRLGATWDATGGSTGEPLRFLRSRRAVAAGLANEARTWRWYGVPAGARQATIWGADRDVAPNASVDSWRARALGFCQLNAFRLDESRCRDFADILERFRPEVIYGYATALARFAAFLSDTGRKLAIRPLAIRSTAEVLLAEHRALVESQLHGPVYDYYGSREVGPIAGESPSHGGLHVFSDVTHVEVVRADGTPCAPGEVGDVVVTKLHEFAMPFVRYRIGDRAAPLADDPADPLGFPRLSSLQGRIGDFVRAPDGREVHGEFFTHLFYGVGGVVRFQVRQPARDRLHVLVQTSGAVDAAALARIRAASAGQLGLALEAVEVECVDHIEPGPSGKHRFVLPFAG